MAAIKVKNLTMYSKPKGKTTIEKGEKSVKGETILILSDRAEIVFFDFDSYMEIRVTIEKAPSPDIENKFLWTHKVPLIEGNFVISSLITKTIDVSPKRI